MKLINYHALFHAFPAPIPLSIQTTDVSNTHWLCPGLFEFIFEVKAKLSHLSIFSNVARWGSAFYKGWERWRRRRFSILSAFELPKPIILSNNKALNRRAFTRTNKLSDKLRIKWSDVESAGFYSADHSYLFVLLIINNGARIIRQEDRTLHL